MITSSQIDETSITQPYVSGRCWFTKKGKTVEQGKQIFCGAQAALYEVRRRDEYKIRGASMIIKMFACSKHVQRLKEKYDVTLIKA